MPSISAMTITGRGMATVSMRSKPSGSSMSSSKVPMRTRIRGSRALMAGRVKALLTRGTQTGVVRRVQKQYGSIVRYGYGSHAQRLSFLRVAGEAGVIAQNRVHVLMAREHQGLHQPAAIRRRPGAQLCVGRIRVLDYSGRHRVVGHSALPALEDQQGIDHQEAHCLRQVVCSLRVSDRQYRIGRQGSHRLSQRECHTHECPRNKNVWAGFINIIRQQETCRYYFPPEICGCILMYLSPDLQ